mmetsp:Transcript_21624/g.31366  ORF Transcript_21624/g.31366 Transcript_21624/m.31366 type:complete len:207 (-) Transcript_21624:443-1063(-)
MSDTASETSLATIWAGFSGQLSQPSCSGRNIPVWTRTDIQSSPAPFAPRISDCGLSPMAYTRCTLLYPMSCARDCIRPLAYLYVSGWGFPSWITSSSGIPGTSGILLHVIPPTASAVWSYSSSMLLAEEADMVARTVMLYRWVRQERNAPSPRRGSQWSQGYSRSGPETYRETTCLPGGAGCPGRPLDLSKSSRICMSRSQFWGVP